MPSSVGILCAKDWPYLAIAYREIWRDMQSQNSTGSSRCVSWDCCAGLECTWHVCRHRHLFVQLRWPESKIGKCLDTSKQNVIVFGLLSGDLNDLSTTGSDQAQAMQSICKPSKHCRCSKQVWYFILLTWCCDHTPGFRANIWQSCFHGAFGVFGLTWDNRQYIDNISSILKNHPIMPNQPLSQSFRKGVCQRGLHAAFAELSWAGF